MGYEGEELQQMLNHQMNQDASGVATANAQDSRAYQENLKVLSDGSGSDDIDDKYSLIQGEKEVKFKNFAQPDSILWGLFNTESPLDSYVKVKAEMDIKLNDPNVSIEKKAKIRKQLYETEQAFKLAESAVSEKLGIDINEIIDNAIIDDTYAFTNEDNEKLTKQSLMSAIEEGAFTAKNNSYILENDRNTTRIWKKNSVVGGNSDYIASIKNSDLEKLKQYNKEINNSLKNDALLPVQSIIIDSGKDADKTRQYISTNIGTMIKSNMSSINTLIKNEETKEYLDNFIKTGNYKDIDLLGFVNSTDGVSMQIQMPSTDEDGVKLMRSVEIPMGKLDTEGSLPTLAQNIFSKLRGELDSKGRDMLDKYEATLRYNLIVPDGNFDNNNKIDYTNDQTSIIKKQLGQVNRNTKSSLFDELYNAKDIRVFNPSKKIMNFDVALPRNAKSMSYIDKKGNEKILTIGDYYNNLKESNPDLNTLELSTILEVYYKTGELINPTQESIFDSSGEVIKELYGLPLITTNTANLIEF
jgi:hypothetical protein